MSEYSVYHLLDDAGNIVYVGMTGSPKARMAAHLKEKVGVREMVIVSTFDNAYDCALEEFDEIVRLNPPLNGGGFREAHARNVLRQIEGIEKARAKGIYKGRALALSDEQVETARAQVAAGVPKTRVAKDLGISRQTLYTALARETT